jgi:hypothetical protein
MQFHLLAKFYSSMMFWPLVELSMQPFNLSIEPVEAFIKSWLY